MSSSPQPTADGAVDSVAALEEVLGVAPQFVRDKIDSQLDPTTREFVAESPLVVVATNDAAGNLDVSPKGDAPGFVHVTPSGELLLPERKGNRLAFGLRNIVETGRIGLIFVVPGRRETLRINGTAEIRRDPELLEQLSMQGKPALLATRVSIDECFFHCGKAFIRSKVWHADTWSTDAGSPIAKQFAAKAGDPTVEAVVADALEADYEHELY
ncbi:MAG: pyridoxamine 5'-phosphate oxidase family protein [Acidimicrobiales bacterium]|nr:pyridoxamine 5'-phosphate oxidase family protein [Acidimicrobiales bacterium]